MQKIRLNINKLQWTFLANNLKQVAVNTPIEDWELHSYVMAECYQRLLSKFTFFPSDKKRTTLRLKNSEAQAINEYFAATSQSYNMLLRLNLEPILPPSKPQPNEEV
jgi:hypothetical protein